ncbi:hypothetical protein EFA46_009210 [Halarchaeum sp. CBA1220]|uniref:DUF6517 family protein n=1 Tax=Halarchaeum sp. CBA1220 TaxID=1853682 RepID=UPI000F3A985F|nr:DUF6517 family protein [Halarchaeum sp. CBA1220]QLC34378.1 hypothetical protein EFA46_009210 [Halarchaeum sp. CBA1220]
MRQKQLVAVGLVVLVALSGCSFLSGPVTFSAEKATVSDQALSETDYEEVAVNQSVITRNFSAAGQSKQVEVTNWIAQYDRSIDLGPLGSKRAAVFSAVATPQVKVLGQGPFNPVSDYSNEQLVMMLQQNYESIDNIQHRSNYTATMLGHETTVGTFSAQAKLQGGQSMDVYVHVTKVQDGDDYVIAVAVYPQQLDDQESQRVQTLLGGVQHGNASA